MTNQALINDLIERTQQNLNAATQLQEFLPRQLNHKHNPESWSALECVEHLNRYGNFYLPEIEKRIKSGAKSSPEAVFKTGVLGNYFAKSMAPKAKLNKMKTFKSMNPIGSALTVEVLDQFIRQQHKMLDLLTLASNTDLSRTKTNVSISKFIKLRLGDTFRVVIYHNQRHLIQAGNAVQ